MSSQVSGSPLARALPIISRERLLARLAGILERRLAVVVAPGGYGKTTLLRALERRLPQVPFAWCSLEPGGGSLPAFLRALAQAVAPYLPGGLHLAAAGREPGGEDEVRELALQFAADLAEQAEEHLVIALDDLHMADGTPGVWSFLQALVAALPDGVHLAVASRTRPRLPLARLKSRGELLEIGSAELSFSAEEARRFFHDLARLPVTEAEVQEILQRTEGWAAGLVLVANAGRTRSVAEGLALLRERGDRQELFAYLAEEVFRDQPADLREFLLRTAVLGTLDPALLHELLPELPVARLMAELEQRNLFLVVDSPGGHFRYHHLFREFLVGQAVLHLGAPAVSLLHRRAAAAALRQGQEERALGHLMAAGDWAGAAPLMASLVEPYLKGMRHEEVHGWLQQVPAPLAEEHPDLAYVRLHQAAWLNQLDVVPGLFERCVDGYTAAGDRSGLIRTLNSLQHYAFKIRQPFFARVARVCSGSPDPEIALRGRQLLAVGLVHAGRWREALSALEDLLPRTPAASVVRYNCQRALALFSFLAADFRRCLQHGVEEIAARNAAGDFSWGIYNWASYAFLGDTVGLELYQRQFAGMAVPAAARCLFNAVTQLGAAMVHLARREWAQAATLLESLRPYFNDGCSFRPSLGPDSTFVARAELARIYQRQGRQEEARELLERNLVLTAAHPELAALALAQLAEHHATRGDLASARTCVGRARSALPPGLTGLASLVAGLAAARVHWAAGEAEAAAAAADPVLAAVLEKGCAYLVVHYGAEALLPVLACMLRHPEQRERVAGWVRALGGEAERFLGGLASHPDAAVARAAAALLALAAPAPGTGSVPAVPEVRVYALGRCEVYVHDRPVAGAEWNRAKMKLLLIRLLLRRGRPLSRDEALQWLWPDADPAAARTSLRVALHGLKRALEPGLSAGQLSRYLLAGRDEIRLVDPSRIWFDLWEFEERITRGRQALREGSRAAGMALFREAVSLWHGPLLPGPAFAGYLAGRRTRVDQAFIRACLELAQDALDRGEAGAAAEMARRALQADPAIEAAFAILIRAHLLRGDREAARHAWKACRKALRHHLGVEPAAETAACLDGGASGG